MREALDRERLAKVMDAFGRAAGRPVSIYFTGGVTAVLEGWRASTIDVDIAIVPEDDALMRALPSVKESLDVNIELAAPMHFIPVPIGWEERSPYVSSSGNAMFYNFDLYAQALSKIERGHERDLADVSAMIERGLIRVDQLQPYFDRVTCDLYRYPALNPAAFRDAVSNVIKAHRAVEQ